MAVPFIQDLEAISLASVQLQSSKSFKRILEVNLKTISVLCSAYTHTHTHTHR